MCGRFTQQRPASELAEIFAAEPLADELGARFNVAPTDEAYVVVQREERRAITAYRWGLVPHWSTDAKAGSRMFNARAETITTSPAFRAAFARRRCLVPVDSFYEWKREGTVRQPYRVVRADGRPLVLAGLWAGWMDPADRDGAPHVHDRDDDARTMPCATSMTACRWSSRTMPGNAGSRRRPACPGQPCPTGTRRRAPRMASTRSSAAGRGETIEPGELLAMLQPRDDIELSIYPVERLVNDVRRDGPELIAPLVAVAAPAAESTFGL